jgi:hypothetical protein
MEDGTFTGKVTFQQYCEQGTWYIDNLIIRDKALPHPKGLQATFSKEDLDSMGFPTELNVVSELLKDQRKRIHERLK